MVVGQDRFAIAEFRTDIALADAADGTCVAKKYVANTVGSTAVFDTGYDALFCCIGVPGQ